MNNKTTRISLVTLIGLLGIMLAAAAVQRMSGLQIGPNPSTTNIDLQANGDIDATGDITAASFTGDGSGLTGISGAAHTIEDEGTPLTARTSLNFVGAGVTAADSGGKTVVTISGGGGGGDALTTNPLSQFAATTSSQFAGVISDETGTGAVVLANSPTLVTPALGTPASGVATNLTGLPISTGLASGTSADLAGRISDETGTGALVLANSPTLVTPHLGTPADGNLANCTFPTLNQSTTGSAATLTTPRAIYGNNFDGSAALTQVIASTYGGTGNGFTKFTGPASTEKTFTLPNASETLAALGQAQTWTGIQSLNSGKLALNGATSGTTTLNAAAIAGTTTLTLPAATDTLVGKATTDTLSNKRITKREGNTTSSATPTINTDNYDIYRLTAQAADITSFTTNLSGSPNIGDQIRIYITGTAARAITWGASFSSGPATLPTTTVTTKQLWTLFEWDGSIWRCMATASNP